MTNYTVNAVDDRCPFATPVSVVNDDTGQIVGCHMYVVDAEKHVNTMKQNDAMQAKAKAERQARFVAFSMPARGDSAWLG